MKKILVSLLLPIRLLVFMLKLVWELVEPLSESISVTMSNLLEENYNFWGETWLKITKTILHKK